MTSAYAQLDTLQQKFADALQAGKVDSLEKLIDEGIDVNAPFVFFANSKNRVEVHPLLFAKTEDVVTLLIQHGINVNARDNSGTTALHAAAWNGRIKIAALLLKNGAKLNLPGSHGRTPLHVATVQGDINMIRLLVEFGADLNSKSDNGMTILHSAVIDNKLEIVEFALKQGVDPMIEDKYGHTALQWALQISRSYDEAFLKIISLLKKYEKNYG